MRLIRSSPFHGPRALSSTRRAVSAAATIAVVAAAGLLAGACNSSTAPVGPGDPPMSGKWIALCGVDVSCTLNLRETRDALAGTFETHFAPTALGSSIATSGTFVNPNVTLQWTDAGVLNRFDGVLLGDTLVSGTVSSSTSQYTLAFFNRD